MVIEAAGMPFDVQVSEVEEDSVVWIHADDPGTVHIVGVVAGIQRGVDLP